MPGLFLIGAASGRVSGLSPEEAPMIAAGHFRLWLVVALDHNEDYQKARIDQVIPKPYALADVRAKANALLANQAAERRETVTI